MLPQHYRWVMLQMFLLCKSSLNGITFHILHSRLQTPWLRFKILYKNFRIFWDDIVRSRSSAIHELYGKAYYLLLRGKCRGKVSLKLWYTYIHIHMASHLRSGPGSSVGIATGYELNGPGIESWWGRDFTHLSRPALGPTQPPVQWVRGVSRGKKRPGRDADPSLPSSAVVMKE